jgi:hypothetical protein
MSLWLVVCLLCLLASLGAAVFYLRARSAVPVGCRRLTPYDPGAPRVGLSPIDCDLKLSVVLPIKIHSHHQHSELERIQRLLLPSFEKFFRVDDLHEFIVIAPPEDLEAVKAGVAPFEDALPLRVLSDDEVVPRVSGMKRGWLKQQILKLGIAGFIRTPSYIVLDTDNLLVRPTSLTDLCPKGLPLLVRERFSTHPGWYRGSARALHYELDFDSDDLVLGVTPQILHTEICRELQREIEERNGVGPWEAVLAQRRVWSEYSLYWLYLTKHFQPETLYDLSGQGLYEDCIWEGAGRFDDAYVRRIFEEAQAPFTVLQSRIPDLSVSQIHARVQRYLEPAVPGAAEGSE